MHARIKRKHTINGFNETITFGFINAKKHTMKSQLNANLFNNVFKDHTLSTKNGITQKYKTL